MKIQENNEVFRSFEQMKADLFPSLTKEERRQSSNFDSSQIGVCLADEAIEELFQKHGKRNT